MIFCTCIIVYYKNNNNNNRLSLNTVKTFLCLLYLILKCRNLLYVWGCWDCMFETLQRIAGARNVLFWTVFLSINVSHHCLHVDVGYPDCCFPPPCHFLYHSDVSLYMSFISCMWVINAQLSFDAKHFFHHLGKEKFYCRHEQGIF